MKKFALILVGLFCLYGLAFGQDLPGVFGVNFGDGPTATDAALLSKGLVFSPSDDNDGSRAYRGGNFNGTRLEATVVSFYKDKAYQVCFILGPINEVSFISTFEDMTSQIKAKYPAAGYTDKSKFNRPYELGDGYEVSAIRLGKAALYRMWILGDSFETARLVSLANSGSDLLTLVYRAQDFAPPRTSDF